MSVMGFPDLLDQYSRLETRLNQQHVEVGALLNHHTEKQKLAASPARAMLIAELRHLRDSFLNLRAHLESARRDAVCACAMAASAFDAELRALEDRFGPAPVAPLAFDIGDSGDENVVNHVRDMNGLGHNDSPDTRAA